jgi:transposase, IS5 family
MRQERTVQAGIFDLFAAHEIGHELKAMSQWLDAHRDLVGLVAQDLARPGVKATGRQGLSAEAVLRCALLKQYRQLSYQELAFHLEDSPRSAPLPVWRRHGAHRSRCCKEQSVRSAP